MGQPDRDRPPAKRTRGGLWRQRRRELQEEDLASVLRCLEEEFAVKERLSNEQTWCTPVPHERKVSTVRGFYRAFHDVDTLPIRTCILCYRKRTARELREMAWDQWMSSPTVKGGRSPFACRSCFREGESVLVCEECSRRLARGVLSPAAQLHSRLGCEHVFPDELKGLTPVEEKLIALNSCYGFHVKGHITVFPNNVQELVTNVLPHSLLQVMDEIHVSWQGAARPTPSDLSSLLSVRRRVVERALVWLRRNNPHYAGIEIDAAEMESWGDSAHGVPPLVYERLERDEPSAWEKTRTAHVVPPTERAMDDEGAVEIEEVLAMLNQGESTTSREAGEPEAGEVGEVRGRSCGEADDDAKTINEVTSSGMFALDGPPDVADVDKLRFAYDAVREGAADGGTGPRTWVETSARGQPGHADGSEPYIHIRRADEFADSLEACFFAKTFPTLLPFGIGGPRPVEEATVPLGRGSANTREVEAGTRDLLSSRNMSLRTWADTVLRRHGGRFATHHIFAFLVFNMGVRSRNRRVSMLSVTRKNFRRVERIVRSLTADRLAAARAELESTGKTTDDGVKELLRSLSLYGYRQPMSRELRLSMRHKILALIVRYGVPAIWITINPNDITNPVKLRLAAHRARDPEAAEEFLRGIDASFKRARLSVSDPMSSAIFFHREMTLFFKHYVNAGGESIFGRISQYYGAVETNERGSLHVHGLLWLHGNAHLSSMLADSHGEEQAAYRERIVRYVDSVFCEAGFCAVRAERSVTSDISSLLNSSEQFSASFEEEANFCAGATQIHTHSPTCVKYSLGNRGRKGDLCRFKAPWKLVEDTAFSSDGVLRIRRTHPMVNRWNKAIAVGLRHNHDISFIATQRKTMALVYYVTNYATKVEDPTWKRIAAAAELLPVVSAGGQPTTGDDARGGVVGDDDGTKNKTRQFLMRVANRVFTERALSQVEVIAHLLGYPSEFTSSSAWAYLNASVLYWHVSRRWRHLRQESGTAVADVSVDESVLRRPGKHAVVCLDGYLSKDFEQDDEESGYRRAAVQHLALFVPWEAFLGEERGDINEIWRRAREQLPPRTSCLVDNVQLLRRSAEDAKRDAKQWAASGGDGDPAGALGEGEGGGPHPADHDAASAYEADNAENATRLIDVVRSAVGAGQITAGSRELSGMIQQLCRFQQSALASTAELQAAIVAERGGRHIDMPGQVFSGAAVPPQDQVKAIKSQQTCASRERVKMIQSIQSMAPAHGTDRGAAERSVLTGFGEEDVQMTRAEAEETAGNAEAGMEVRLGPSTSFVEAGKGLTTRLTLNRKQAIAFSIICRHLDSMRQGDGGDVSQLCQFVGGEGGTGKSRVVEALVGLFAAKGLSHRLLITATSGTAAARVNGITIHSACGFTKDQGPGANTANDFDGVRLPKQAERFVNGQSRMDWQDKDVLVIDEVSMLGSRTLHAVNERLCQLRGSQRDFGGIPVVLFCGDFHQFRPVQERSILLPSAAVSWDEDDSFRAEQRHQHDKAHGLWKRFTTVVMLDEQMRAAGDPELQRLLRRIRQGVQDRSDLDLLNSRCHREGRRIPWETGITVVTPLNRNRWNLNMEASLAFQTQQRSTLRIFLSEHKWKDGLPTEEEAVMMLNQGDDSAIPVPAVFMFVPGMPVVVNHNTHQGLKLVNGASYTAAEVIIDKAYPGHRISADTTIHFGPPAAIILGSETTKDFHFVGMPPGTILLTPMSVRIQRKRKRPWQQNDVSRKGPPCAAAFACTDYKVQGGTLERVALELRGTRTTNVGGRAVPSQCDPYSLYVQLSRCPTLDGIMLVSKARERDLVGNRVPGEMTAAQARLEELSDRTVREALRWLGDEVEGADLGGSPPQTMMRSLRSEAEVGGNGRRGVYRVCKAFGTSSRSISIAIIALGCHVYSDELGECKVPKQQFVDVLFFAE
ncbi:PIF1-like helicase [Hirsutella rhossiliensis]